MYVCIRLDSDVTFCRMKIIALDHSTISSFHRGGGGQPTKAFIYKFHILTTDGYGYRWIYSNSFLDSNKMLLYLCLCYIVQQKNAYTYIILMLYSARKVEVTSSDDLFRLSGMTVSSFLEHVAFLTLTFSLPNNQNSKIRRFRLARKYNCIMIQRRMLGFISGLSGDSERERERDREKKKRERFIYIFI